LISGSPVHPPRTWFLPYACALGLLLVAGCERPGVDADDGDPADTGLMAATELPPPGVTAAKERWVAGWNGDNAMAVATVYVDDATATIGDTTYRGRAEIENWISHNVAVVSNLRLTPTSTQRTNGSWREEGTFSHLTSPPDIEPFTAEGRYSLTWMTDAAGDWRLRSTDIQPNPPPES
jgi:ketosteroid isomerase-like protein